MSDIAKHRTNNFKYNIPSSLLLQVLRSTPPTFVKTTRSMLLIKDTISSMTHGTYSLRKATKISKISLTKSKTIVIVH